LPKIGSLKMNEILTINTSDNLVEQKRVEPLPLYDENYFMLAEKLPEYSDPLPNPIMSNLAERLKVTMKMYNGIGLSANQCGVAVRMFVLGYEDFSMTCINPKVITTSAKANLDNEGCLSFPGLYCKVARPEWVEVEYTTPSGEVNQTRLEGLTARCFLHELDHMNGVKITDHMGPVKLKMARQKQLKRIKSAKRKLKK
jgi:peptide deformylase